MNIKQRLINVLKNMDTSLLQFVMLTLILLFLAKNSLDIISKVIFFMDITILTILGIIQLIISLKV